MDSGNLCTCADNLAMAGIPKQEWCEPYDFTTALAEGTIFPSLNLTFLRHRKENVTARQAAIRQICPNKTGKSS